MGSGNKFDDKSHDNDEKYSKINMSKFIDAPEDRVPVPTPAHRFARNRELTRVPVDQVGQITPTPVQLERRAGQVALTAATTIYYEDALKRERCAKRIQYHAEKFLLHKSASDPEVERYLRESR